MHFCYDVICKISGTVSVPTASQVKNWTLFVAMWRLTALISVLREWVVNHFVSYLLDLTAIKSDRIYLLSLFGRATWANRKKQV